MPALALLLAVLAIPLLMPAANARAQGTSGTLPDPISGRDLSAYARRLGLGTVGAEWAWGIALGAIFFDLGLLVGAG